MPDKLKVGIVGCGGVVPQEHIPSFSRLPNVVIQAVCEKNQELARQTAARHLTPPPAATAAIKPDSKN